MFNLNEFIVTNTVNGVKNGTFTKEYANIMAVNYMMNNMLTQDNVISINSQIEELELEQSQKAEINNDFIIGEEITEDDKNVSISDKYESTEGNNEDILTEETEQPIDLDDDGEPLI